VNFKTPSGEPFEIPDEWWNCAEMDGFSRGVRTAFVHDPTLSYKPTMELAIAEIKPPTRNPGVALFEKSRMISILRAFRTSAQLPAVEVRELDTRGGGRYRYSVYHGCHRFYASIAVGYVHLPITILPTDAY
jgi:hypothetical protein